MIPPWAPMQMPLAPLQMQAPMQMQATQMKAPMQMQATQIQAPMQIQAPEQAAQAAAAALRSQKRSALFTLLKYGLLVMLAAALVAYALTKFVYVPNHARDCQLGEWSNWSGCKNGSCNGIASRTRLITREAAFGGHQCFEADLVQTIPCTELNACDARDCQYGPPLAIATCSANACYDASSGECMQGSGEQVLYNPIVREPLPGGKACDWDFVFQITPCNVTQSCSGAQGPPQDCVMSSWSSYTECQPPDALCALPGDPPWWQYSYRYVETPAVGSGLPCNAIDMVRSRTCPQNTCTWCSLSWDNSIFSQPTYPCGAATAFREAQVIADGTLPCFPQQVSATSIGDCAKGSFDAYFSATCDPTSYDYSISCASYPLSKSHQPPTLWAMAQAHVLKRGAFENLTAGEFEALTAPGAGLSAGDSFQAMPAALAQNMVPPPDANGDYRAFCMMACAESAACSAVVVDESTQEGWMLMNYSQSSAAMCTGAPNADAAMNTAQNYGVGALGAAAAAASTFFVSIDSNTLQAATAAAAASTQKGTLGDYYASDAAVVNRLVQMWGFQLASVAEIEALLQDGCEIPPDSLIEGTGLVSDGDGSAQFYRQCTLYQKIDAHTGAASVDVTCDNSLHAATIENGVRLQGAWVTGAKPPPNADTSMLFGYQAAACVAPDAWQPGPAPLVDAQKAALPEVFFVLPSAEILQHVQQYYVTGFGTSAQVDSDILVRRAALSSGFQLATADQVLAAGAVGMAIPSSFGVASGFVDFEGTPMTAVINGQVKNYVESEFGNPSPLLNPTSGTEGAATQYYARQHTRLFTSDITSSDNISIQSFTRWSQPLSDTLNQKLGAWVYGFKPLGNVHYFSVAPFSETQWSQHALSAADVAAAPPSSMTAYVWNPQGTQCERVVWPMLGAACLEVCWAGTDHTIDIGHGQQPVLNRGQFTATVFPLSNGSLSCPITPQMMENADAAGNWGCKPDPSSGLWTSASCPLSQDCVYQSWSQAGPWGHCDTQCGVGDGGARYRVRGIVQNNSFLGAPCDSLELTESAACHAAFDTTASSMSCAPGARDPKPSFATDFDTCKNACASAPMQQQIDGSQLPCSAYMWDYGLNKCQLFYAAGGLDALLTAGVCSGSSHANMYEPPCDVAQDCSLTSWTNLNVCGGCATPFAYQKRSIVAGASNGGLPCSSFPTMRSVTCGASNSGCSDTPCLYGPWPSDQNTFSLDLKYSACEENLDTPTLFTAEWAPNFATGMLRVAQSGGTNNYPPNPWASLSTLERSLNGFSNQDPSYANNGNLTRVSWDAAEVLNAQCFNADGTAPSCFQSFPAITGATNLINLENPALSANWRGDTWGWDPVSAAWVPLVNGGPQPFLAQFTADVDAFKSVADLVNALDTAGWQLATQPQIDVATQDFGMAGPQGSDSTFPVLLDGNEVMTAIVNGTATYASAAGLSLSALYGAWLYGPKPVPGAHYAYLNIQPFSGSTWNIGPSFNEFTSERNNWNSPGSLVLGTCPNGIDPSWIDCALERIVLKTADARLMYDTSASAWRCPSLCPTIPAFCSWSACDVTCSSNIYPGQRTMGRTISQYASADSAQQCHPLDLFSQTSCLNLPPCGIMCPYASNGSECNSTTCWTAADGSQQCAGTCTAEGTCSCAPNFTGSTCDHACFLDAQGNVCGGPTRGVCLPSGDCDCLNGYGGVACDQAPIVALGNSKLIATLMAADSTNNTANTTWAPNSVSYVVYNGAGQSPCASVSGAFVHCDVCVPYVGAISADVNGTGFVQSKYLNVLYSPDLNVQNQPIASWRDACVQFWNLDSWPNPVPGHNGVLTSFSQLAQTNAINNLPSFADNLVFLTPTTG